MSWFRFAICAFVCVVAAACVPTPAPQAQRRASPAGRQQASTPAAPATAAPRTAAAPTPDQQSAAPRPPQASARPRPAWLGQRILPRRPGGYGEIRPTPPVLRNRRLTTVDHLPPPRTARFTARVVDIPPDVLRRSTWSPACPVAKNDLRYVTVAFWGFDQRPHTGELLVHASVARDMVDVFRQLFRARFPIEQMRVVDRAELDLPPTGDGNNTTGFVCRPSRGTTSWSQHAYGLAVDVNPFHNPYVNDDVVLPELASAYTNREWRRPGMLFRRSVAVTAFAAVGWEWGGNWSSLTDYMHFSHNGR